MRPEKRDRAYGPYPHRDKWRVVVIGADGERTTATFASKATAQQRVTEVNAEAIGRTVSAAIEAFLAQSTAKTRSKKTFEHRLRGITGDGDRLLRRLTPRVAREHFAERSVKTSGDTQFHELASAHAFARWCMGQGWIALDPFAGLEPTKARKRGKKQLRIDEARKLLDACLSEKSAAATAVAVALLFGMRASSITNRQVRDLDDGGRVLWIENDKTDAGDRTLGVPEVIRARLLALAANKRPDARLFPNTDRSWLRYHVRRLCGVAGVPIVCPHGLRGTWASLSRREVSVDHVARALGHAGPSITRSNYIAPGVERGLDQQTVLAVLGKTVAESFPRTEKHESFT